MLSNGKYGILIIPNTAENWIKVINKLINGEIIIKNIVVNNLRKMSDVTIEITTIYKKMV
jgi:hypothetical protein